MAHPVQTLPTSMTCLPMPTCCPQTVMPPAVSGMPEPEGLLLNSDDHGAFLRAFQLFTEASRSLEISYRELGQEVQGLRRELEDRNRELARSLEENRSMRVHLNRILEGLPCGVLVVSGDGQILQINPEAARLLKDANPGVKAGMPASVTSLPQVVRELLERSQVTADEQEVRLVGVRGSARWLAVRHASVSDSAVLVSVFILRDISDRKRLEAAQDKLCREQALAEMSAVLAHEIRNPLGSLELFAGLLAEAGLDSECRQWVQHVQAGLRTLGATVNNVLHFHSLPEPEHTPVDLGQLLDWAHDFFAPLARQANIQLKLQNHVGGVYLSADRHRLEQVLLNLMLNAMRAMPGGGWIELRGRRSSNHGAVSLVVTDTGPGISPEILPRIFEPGFSTRKSSPGLGLTVCRKIVEQHGGDITAASRPGSGAAFTLTFPLVPRQVVGVAG